jgi:hypothetical protein
MHSLFAPNIALLPTYVSFFTAGKTFVFLKFSHCAYYFRFRQQIKLTIQLFKKRKWPEHFSGTRLLPAACTELTQEQQRVLKLAKDGHNLVFTGKCGTGKTHLLRCLFIHKFGYSNLTLKCRIKGRFSISIYQFGVAAIYILWLPPFSVNARVLLQLVSYKIIYKKH